MNHPFHLRWLGLAAALACAVATAQTVPQVRAVQNPGVPPTRGTAGTTPAPAAQGPSASGLRSQFPAGLPTPIPRGGGGTTNAVVDGVVVDAVPATPSMGAAGSYGVPAGSQYVPMGRGGSGWSTVEIASSFLQADINRDGELTRAEGTRLTILPLSFEEMDRNKDGILTRFEYEDALR